MSDPRNEFVPEAEDLLQEAESGLLKLQEAGGRAPEVLNAVFRSMHTLKGTSGLFGLIGISELSHALESLLDDMRLGRRTADQALFAFLFAQVDHLRGLVNEVSREGRELTDCSEYLGDVRRFLQGGAAEAPRKSLADLGVPEEIARVLTEYEEHRLRTNLEEGEGLWIASAEYSLDSFEEGLERLSGALRDVGELIATMPGTGSVGTGTLGFGLLFASDENETVLRQIADGKLRRLVEARSRSTSAAGNAGVGKQAGEDEGSREGEAGAPELRSFTNTVRVDIRKLDGILNTVGELLLAKSAVVRISKELQEMAGFAAKGTDLQKVTRNLERRLSELQDQILEVRMVPIGQIFSRLSQAVKRYTRDMGREIVLHVYGEETEVDKLLAEEVIDPLMHLIRNAVDHGLETRDERIAAGKSVQGNITLKAFPRGNHVIIQVIDDGRGIALDTVVRKARAKGLVEPGRDLSTQEVLNLIFVPGFSTKEIVSEVSGRGVGMDVVKEKVGTLGGFVDVETSEGEGTTFSITLPITLAIIKALLIKVGPERYAIPLSAVSETVVIGSADIRRIEGKEVVDLRGEMLPLLRIAQVFKLENIHKAANLFVVVAGFGARRLGLIVDELVGQQEVVIKSLGERLQSIGGIAGAAEIGRHEVILVLDVESLMEESMMSRRRLRSLDNGD